MSAHMRTAKIARIVFLGLVFAFSLILQSHERQSVHPEYRLFVRARRIEDPNARITELERIKAEYPESTYRVLIENAIIDAKIELSTTLEDILKLQRLRFQRARGLNRLFLFNYAGLDILQHKRSLQFDKKKMTQVILMYAEEAEKFAKNPEFLQRVPEHQKPLIARALAMCHLVIARAYLNEGNPQKSSEALESYLEKGGEKDKVFWYIQGATLEKLGETEEAFDSFFRAAAENFGDSIDRARGLYKNLYGGLEGFEERLEAKQRELPFYPAKFKPSRVWKGKAVLAELFTGSECPPCVAADMGFDGLMETYSQDYLVILEYHLPIPRPDPLMNEVTRARAFYYGVNSTPTVFIDGEKELKGGGPRSKAETKFDEYSIEIGSHLDIKPQIILRVSAKRNGDDVLANLSFDGEIANADYNVALVEDEVKYAGGNGILFHKKVVRDFKTVTPREVKDKNFVFKILDAERTGAKRLDDYEKETNFSFKEKHFAIDRNRLQVVFFVQDRSSRKVYNAAVCNVE